MEVMGIVSSSSGLGVGRVEGGGGLLGLVGGLLEAGGLGLGGLTLAGGGDLGLRGGGLLGLLLALDGPLALGRLLFDLGLGDGALALEALLLGLGRCFRAQSQ